MQDTQKGKGGWEDKSHLPHTVFSDEGPSLPTLYLACLLGLPSLADMCLVSVGVQALWREDVATLQLLIQSLISGKPALRLLPPTPNDK